MVSRNSDHRNYEQVEDHYSDVSAIQIPSVHLSPSLNVPKHCEFKFYHELTGMFRMTMEPV